MRLGFVDGLGLPAVVRARLRLGPPRGQAGGSGLRDALAALAASIAPPSLRDVRLPAVYERPLIALVNAGVFDEAFKLDYNHLYARLAADILERHGYTTEAEWFRAWVRRREQLPTSLAERYILVSSPTSFAEAWRSGRRSSAALCRRWWREAAEEPPLTRDELREELMRARCEAYAVLVKDVIKFTPHILVGLSRRWGTGLWERVVTEANKALRELAAPLQENGSLLSLYVDSVVVAGEPRGLPRTRHPYKVEARGDAVVVIPPLYRVGERYGLWGVYMEEPVVVERVIDSEGYLVVFGGRYEGGEAALRCEKPLARSRDIVVGAALKLGVRVGRVLCELRDETPGVERLVHRAVYANPRVGAAEPPHVPPHVAYGSAAVAEV